jgi:beta-xylosidase
MEILLPNKITKRVLGYPKYAVSTDGDIYSCFKGDWKQLKPYPNSDGYLIIRLFKESKKGKMFSMHRLVAQNFLNEIEGCVVDHIDNDKKNNKISNLRWITQKQNLLKKYREDGHKTHFAKKVAQKSIDGEIIRTYLSALDAAKYLGIDQSAISKVCRGLFKQSGGYKWEYVK